MLLTEEQIKKITENWLRYPIVESTCIWCSACAAISPDVFIMNDEWKSDVLSLESYEDLWVDDSIMACPVECIKWKN
jgi:ferredoxin